MSQGQTYHIYIYTMHIELGKLYIYAPLARMYIHIYLHIYSPTTYTKHPLETPMKSSNTLLEACEELHGEVVVKLRASFTFSRGHMEGLEIYGASYNSICIQ